MPLTKEELERPQSAADMLPWANALAQRLSATKELRAEARIGKHFARELMDEFLPLARFAHRFYEASPEVIIHYIMGNQNHDAVVEDSRAARSSIQYLEATTTLVTYDESLRMELLTRDGHAPAVGRIVAKGPRHARISIEAELKAVDHEAIVAEHLQRIARVVTTKAAKGYPEATALVVAIDDYLAFRFTEDAARLDALAHEQLLPALTPTNFCALALEGGAGVHRYFPLR
jgi:hypothetical protein